MSGICIYILSGAAGGLIGEIGRNKNVFSLPRICRKDGALGLDLGSFSSILIGAFVGYAADHSPVVSGLAGYAGIKMVDYLLHSLFPEYVESRRAKANGGTPEGTSTEGGE